VPLDRDVLGDLLRRPVTRLETETAPMAGLERVVALELDGGTRFPLPAGNPLRSAGDVAEVRALLDGWPREVARRLRLHLGAGDPVAREAEIEAALVALAEDPDGTLDAWAATGPGTPLDLRRR
jgi:hypothetical protein